MRHLIGKKGNRLFLIESSPEYPTFISAEDLRKEDKIYVFGKETNKNLGYVLSSLVSSDLISILDKTSSISIFYDFFYLQFKVNYDTRIFKKAFLVSIETPVLSKYYKKEVENGEVVFIKEKTDKSLLSSYAKSKNLLPLKLKFKVEMKNYLTSPSLIISFNTFINLKKKVGYLTDNINIKKRKEKKLVWTGFSRVAQSAKLVTGNAAGSILIQKKGEVVSLGFELSSITLAYKLKSGGVRTEPIKISSSYSYKATGRILASLLRAQNQS